MQLNLDPSIIKHIHILGICGTAMGAFAGMLQELGYRITGSDAHAYPPMSTQLEALGIDLKIGYDPKNLEPRPDLVIVGNVIPRINLEAQAMEAMGIPFISMPDAMGQFFLAQKRSLVVAGTHGKTTTSSMLAWCLHHNQRDPSFLIGGQLQNFGRNAHLGQGQDFVIEGDEYDTAYFDKGPKFLHYRPKHAIVTSVEFDHADIYDDLAHIQRSFRKFLKLLPQDAHLLACTDYPALVELLPETQAHIITYGLTGSPTWSGRINQSHPDGMHITLTKNGVDIIDLQPNFTGEHNLLNMMAVSALLLELGLSHSELQGAFATFNGVKRRQEVIAEVDGITILDDFAHHPTAVELTIAAVRARYADRRLWAVFEPRSNSSRRNIFQEQYAKAFDLADHILIAHAQNVARIDAADRMDAPALARDIAVRGNDAQDIDSTAGIIDHLLQNARSGDVILIMSNGGFDGIYKALPEALAARPT